MIAQVEVIAVWATEGLGLSARDADGIIGPVGDEISNRFGPDLGPRLVGEFSAAFRAAPSRGGKAAVPAGGGLPLDESFRREFLAAIRLLKATVSGLADATESTRKHADYPGMIATLQDSNAKLDLILRYLRSDLETPEDA